MKVVTLMCEVICAITPVLLLALLMEVRLKSRVESRMKMLGGRLYRRLKRIESVHAMSMGMMTMLQETLKKRGFGPCLAHRHW